MSHTPAAAAAAATRPSRSITAIVAATTSNGIGINGGLPWRLPGEMKYFARVTTGSPSAEGSSPNAVIMGRKTWESIPPRFRPLKDRRNLVVSRQGVDVGESPSTTVHPSLESAIDALPQDSARTFLIGGSQLYTSSLTASPPLVDRVLLTRIQGEITCDAFLEDFTAHTRDGRKVWRLASIDELRDWIGFEVDEQVEEKGLTYRFEMWVLN